jgi:hypothetical protein
MKRKPAAAARGKAGTKRSRGGASFPDVGAGLEPWPVPLVAGAEVPEFRYTCRNLNRTFLTVSGVMMPELLDRSASTLSRQSIAKHLKQYHREPNRIYELRKQQCAGNATDLPSFGCGKCRWSPKGCGRCREAGFSIGPKEGKTGGIPKPATEHKMQVVGHAEDGGGILAPALAVTVNAPICQRLREKGYGDGGYGVITTQEIAEGTPVLEYVGEVLTKEQAEAREAWYVKQSFKCSYQLDCGAHFIDPTLHGNIARLMNSSCQPNLRKTAWQPKSSADADAEGSQQGFKNLPRVLFIAARTIKVGEELTWEYSSTGDNPDAQGMSNRERRALERSGQGGQSREEEQQEQERHVCICGAPGCKGRL